MSLLVNYYWGQEGRIQKVVEASESQNDLPQDLFFPSIRDIT